MHRRGDPRSGAAACVPSCAQSAAGPDSPAPIRNLRSFDFICRSKAAVLTDFSSSPFRRARLSVNVSAIRNYMVVVFLAAISPVALGCAGALWCRIKAPASETGTNVPQSIFVTVPGRHVSIASAILLTCGRITGQFVADRIRMAKGRRRSCCSNSIRLSLVRNASNPDTSIWLSRLPFLAPFQPSDRTVRISWPGRLSARHSGTPSSNTTLNE
jgi:hypothetical protein